MERNKAIDKGVYMDIVKLSWSGGADSTCAALEHLDSGHKLKICCYVPKFNEEIPLILKCHYDYIMNTAQYFIDRGAEVYIVHGATYFDYCTHVALSGKYKGRIFGFPCFQTGKCYFKKYSKISALDALDVGYYDYESIGICSDEYHRHGQLNKNKRSILVERGITQSAAKGKCSISPCGISPLYYLSARDGCTVCPNASRYVLEKWFEDYPGAREALKELQNICKEKRPERKPLRTGWFEL